MSDAKRHGLSALGASPMTWDQFPAELASARDAYAVARVVAIAGSELLGADRGCLFVADERGDWHMLAAIGFAHEAFSDYLVIEAGGELPLAQVGASQEPMLFESNREFAAQFARLEGEREHEGLEAEAILALASHGTAYGVVIFDWHEPRQFTPSLREELSLLATLGATHLERVIASSPRFPTRP
jgi:transcriptional regulator with GAF, ATPase, and Fis domain